MYIIIIKSLLPIISGLQDKWSLMAVVSQDRSPCTVLLVVCNMVLLFLNGHCQQMLRSLMYPLIVFGITTLDAIKLRPLIVGNLSLMWPYYFLARG